VGGESGPMGVRFMDFENMGFEPRRLVFNLRFAGSLPDFSIRSQGFEDQLRKCK
jgi:hypothetical protein